MRVPPRSRPAARDLPQPAFQVRAGTVGPARPRCCVTIRLRHSSSEPGNQLPGLGPVAASAEGLKIRFFGLAPFADRNDVIHFELGCAPAFSTATAVA